jgi:hypothetical protein
MALTTKSITGNGARGHHYFVLKVDENSTSVANNTSSLSFSFVISNYGGAWDWYGWGTSISYTININGSKYTGYIPDYDGVSSVTLKTGSLNVEHSSDGTKSINISFSVTDGAGKTYTCGNASASGKMTLSTIPRNATITNAPDFNDEQNPTITYQNLAGDSVSTLQACISLTGAIDDISYRDISISGTSYTFELTDEERNILRNATTTSKTRQITFFIKTILNGVTFHSTATKTLTIVNANPTFTSDLVTYQDVDTLSVNVTGNNQHIVQNKSLLEVYYKSATAKKGASISSYTFILNGENRTSTTATGTINFGYINSANDLTLTCVATDTRGYSTTITKVIKMLAYSEPTMQISLNRKNNYENTTYLKVDGSIASVDNKNIMYIKYRYKLKGGTYATDEFGQGIYTYINDNVEEELSLDNTKEYIFNVIVLDMFNTQNSVELPLGKGVFPLFIDTIRNGIGVNTFLEDGEVFRTTGGNAHIENNLIVDGEISNKVLPNAKNIDDLNSFDDVGENEVLNKSGLYSVSENDKWYNLINLRHRNGLDDGVRYGMQIRSTMTDLEGDLEFRKNHNGIWSNWKRIQSDPIVLFDDVDSGGTTEEVTLSENSSNFSYIELFITKDESSGIWSVKTPSPNGRTIQVGTTYYAGSALQVIGKTVKIEGNKIKHNTEFYINFNTSNGTVSSIGGQKTVKILKVIGYR